MRGSRGLLLAALLFSVPGVLPAADIAARGEEYLELRRIIGNRSLAHALERVQVLIARYPDFLPLYETLPEVARYSNRLDVAEAFFDARIRHGEKLEYAYFGMGEVLRRRRDFGRALEFYAYAQRRGLELPEVYSAIADCFCRTHTLEEAVDYFTGMCHRSPDNPNAWYALAMVYWESRNYRMINKCLTEAISYAPKIYQYRLAHVCCTILLDKYEDAIRTIPPLLELLSRRFDPEGELFLLNYLAYSKIQLRDMEEAQQDLNRAADLASSLGFLGSLAWSNSMQADLYYLWGKYNNSIHASRAAEALLPLVDDSGICFAVYGRLHQSLLEIGEFDQAILAACTAGSESLKLKNELQLMLALAALSGASRTIGMDSLSFELAIEAMTRLERCAPDPYTRVVVETSLGEAYCALGKFTQGIGLFHDPLKDSNTYVARSLAATTSHGNLGGAYLGENQLGLAKDHFNAQLKLSEVQHFDRERATALVNLGSHSEVLGATLQARSHYQNAAAIIEGLGLKSLKAKCFLGLARTCLSAKDTAAAVMQMRQALEVLTEQIPSVDFSGNDNSLRKIHGNATRRLVSVLSGKGLISESMVEVHALSRPPLHLDRWRFQKLLQLSDSCDKAHQIVSDLSAAAGRYAKWMMRGIDRQRWGNRPGDIDSILSILSFEAALRLSVRESSQWLGLSFPDRPVTYNSDRVTPEFGRDIASVWFVVGEDRTEVFIERDNRLSHVSLNLPKNRLEQSIEVMRNNLLLLRIPKAHDGKTRIVRFAKNAHEVFKLVLEPWIGLVQGCARLRLFPDGCLTGLPFEILVSSIGSGTAHDGEAKIHYVAEDFAFSYGIQPFREESHGSALETGTRTVLAIGGVAYPRRNEVGVVDRFKEESQVLHSIPGTETEVELIRSIMGEGTTQLTGTSATKAALLSRLGGSGILHVSTHCINNSANPLLSSLCMSPTGSDGDDLVFGYELIGRRIGAHLVVLSGCCTFGTIAKDEFAGMALLCYVMGARNVVGSRWPVDDKSTTELMKRFYVGLKAGESISVALQKAKVSMIHDGIDNPILWAPFIVVGDDQPVETTAPDVLRMGDWWTWWSVIVVLCVLCTAVISNRRLACLRRSQGSTFPS